MLKLLPLLAAIVLTLLIAATGDGGAERGRRCRAGEISLGAITATAALTLWAMVGFESATIPAGHVRDPERTIPRATMIGTLAVGLVYLLACSGVALLLPPDAGGRAPTPRSPTSSAATGGRARPRWSPCSRRSARSARSTAGC